MLVAAALMALGVAVNATSWFGWDVAGFLSRFTTDPSVLSLFSRLGPYAGDAMFRGMVLAVFGWFLFLRWDTVRSFIDREGLWIAVSASALIALWAPIALVGHSAEFDGERYWWLTDDAMISMRYAANLASGDGLVWNPGERVEGYTNFLWTIYMALFHTVGVPWPKTSLFVLLTNLAIAAGTAPVIARFARALGGDSITAFASVCAYALNKNVMYWSTEGMEFTLLSFLVLASCCRTLQDSGRGKIRPSTYLIIGVISLVRADAIVLSTLLCALSLALAEDKKRALLYSLIALAAPLCHLVFRVWYYGDIVPNTARLKVLGWDQRTAAGLEYVKQFGIRYALFCALLFVGLAIFSDAKRRCVGIGLLIYTSYIFFVGGDAWQDFRFFTPVLPVLMALGFLTIQELGLRDATRLAVCAVCIVSMPLVTPSSYAIYLLSRDVEQENVKIGLMIKRNTSLAASVAENAIGSTLYFSQRRGIDFLGKCDAHIARLTPAVSEAKAGHNKFDFDYSLGTLKPDIVVNVKPADAKYGLGPESKPQPMPADTLLYFHPLFRKHCLPNPVNIRTERQIYICDWSRELENKDHWIDISIGK